MATAGRITVGSGPVDPARSGRVRAAVAPIVALVTTVLVAVGRLIVTPTFYFADDSQTGTAGQWWQLGEYLLAGKIPILDPHAWTAGNYLAEGQWGLFNPLIWVFAVFTRLSGDLLLSVTVVKILGLALMTGGIYLLARSFGASPAWSAAAGVAGPLGGFTVYMDAASWTTGLLASAVFPWVWWGLRRYVGGTRGPLAYLVGAWMLITLGYVFGVIVLVVVFAEALCRAALERDGRRILRVLLAGTYAGLLTIAVYLPGVLTASVTVRDSPEIANLGFLNADLSDALSSTSPIVTGTVGAWWGDATSAPLMYTLWALPALVLFVPSRATLRRLVPLLVVGGALLLLVLGPDQVGPIRWPVRFMPYVVAVVAVVFAVCASSAQRREPSRRTLWWALGLVLFCSWGAWATVPWQWRQVVLSLIVQTVGLMALWVLRSRPPRRVAARAASWSAAVVVAVSVAFVVPQLYLFPSTPLPQLAGVRDARQAADVPGQVADDVIVVGDVYAGWRAPASFSDRLIANQWYLSDATVSSLYTVLPHRTYTTDLCADLRGSTCATALATLTGPDATTGRDVAALLGVNTLIVMKATFPAGLPELPSGWRVAADRGTTWIVERTDPVHTAGGVAWAGSGTRVEETRRGATDLVLRVDSVGEDPRVVVSRLAWPGYSVQGGGAHLIDSVRGYLLTVDLSGARPGDTVTISFRPPGWALELTSLLLALGALVLWPVADHLARRRGRGRLRGSAGERR